MTGGPFGPVARALVVHELLERGRDRWVLVVTGLFITLAGGVGLYGKAAEGAEGALTAPSLMTLCSFLVPLVALVLGHDAIVGERERNTLGLLFSLPVRRGEVLLAKFLGRALALALAVILGLGTAAAVLGGGQADRLLYLVLPTLLLGLCFLSIGVAISTFVERRATAASAIVSVWFLFVLFYDMGLLALLVATDGQVPQSVVVGLVAANPAGLYRMGVLVDLVGPAALGEMGLGAALPSIPVRDAIWGAWVVVPLVLGGIGLARRRTVSS